MKPTTPKHVPIDRVSRYPGNARTHDLDLIQESLATTGQYKPLLVQQSTGHIIAGNGTHEAAIRLGWPKIWVSYLDVDDTAARRIVLVDNRAGDKASYDQRALVALLQNMDQELHGTGFDEDELERLVAQLEVPDVLEPEGQGNDGDAPQLNKLTAGTLKATITDEELEWLMAAHADYLDTAGTDYGFLTWLLEGEARGLRP